MSLQTFLKCKAIFSKISKFLFPYFQNDKIFLKKIKDNILTKSYESFVWKKKTQPNSMMSNMKPFFNVNKVNEIWELLRRGRFSKNNLKFFGTTSPLVICFHSIVWNISDLLLNFCCVAWKKVNDNILFLSEIPLKTIPLNSVDQMPLSHDHT